MVMEEKKSNKKLTEEDISPLAILDGLHDHTKEILEYIVNLFGIPVEVSIVINIDKDYLELERDGFICTSTVNLEALKYSIDSAIEREKQGEIHSYDKESDKEKLH